MAPLALAVASTSCSSTLNEYQCAEDRDCSGEADGRCEASGHCSFEDSSCESGFRFGKNSGTESRTCADDIVPIDGGIEEGTVAIIRAIDMPCGETSAVFDGSQSVARAGTTLSEFAWQIIGPDNDVVVDVVGAPTSPVSLGLHRLGGTYESPILNATPYEGALAIFVDINASGTGPAPFLFTPLLDFDEGSFEGSIELDLNFAVASTNGASQVNVKIFDDFATVLENRVVPFEAGMEGQQLMFNLSADMGFFQPLFLVFEFDVAGNYWLDNVSLVRSGTSEQLVGNGSVENNATPWRFGSGDEQDPLATRNSLPTELQKPGLYKAQLRVRDSAAGQSELAEITFEISDCDSDD